MFRKKILSLVNDHIRGGHEKIKVLPGKCRYNFHCHSNAVHEAITKKHSHIALVVYFDGKEPAVHFINYHKDKFIDNTLGVWSSQYDYYFIRFLEEAEFFDVYRIHTSYRKALRSMLPFYCRLFHKFNSL